MKKNKSKIYTAATAHLDTSWLWPLEETVNNYIPDTVKSNFRLLEKYPEYKFNFEGSYRYELIKEYYPEDFEKIRSYIKSGRWHPCGACYENGDVNIPSPEALTRNILYGNGFFEKEFGVRSNDIFLPDCFGFGKALPSVAAHSGLTGFSTGKLFWGCSVDVPFDTGKWLGPDGKGIWAALMPFSYTTAFGKMEKAKRVHEKIENNKKKNLPGITLAYHGIGDRGGAPCKSSVKNVVNAQRNNEESDFEVFSATTKEFFDAVDSLPEEEKSKLPVYDGEFLLTAHGAGSYTSRTVTKRWNRRCELLADAAERFAGAAFVNGLIKYPQYSIDTAWKKAIAHHFHDDITGTSFEECYKRNHNDYVQAMNTLSAEYTAACKALSAQLDTSFAQGIPVVVSNPVQTASTRKEAVKVKINGTAESYRVFNKDGEEVPSQTKAISPTEKEITFAADVPSNALAVYDLREAEEASALSTQLCVCENHIENKNLRVEIDSHGDICSVFDKRLNKELLAKPVKLLLLNNTHSFDWPAWEVKYADLCEKPYATAEKPTVKILDSGAALASLEITRTAGKSTFRQIVSLDSESEYVSVYNETDWREEATLLKAEFSFTAENDFASYDIGMGCTRRGTNTEKLCEVPAQKWADITAEDESCGVSVFSDSRTGWDKPDKSTLRLTLVHTPLTGYRWECSQHVMDMGLNRYSFAVMGHKGSPETVTQYADSFCQPMHTFVTEKHAGTFGREYSFVKLNNDTVRITALKKAQDSDRIVLRVTECSGRDCENVEAVFSKPIIEAYAIRGDEAEIGAYPVKDGKLCFDIKHNEIKSFALVFEKAESKADCGKRITLNYNATGITADSGRGTATLKGGISVPRELTPDKLLFAGVEYEFSADSKNCLVCDDSKITVGEGFRKLHLLLTSLDGDKTVEFRCGEKAYKIPVQDCFEEVGHWDFMQEKLTGYIKPRPQAVTFTHTHGKNGNMTAKQFYVFHAEIPLDGGTEVTLPTDESIVIFAATAEKADYAFKKGDGHFDSLEKRKFDYEFSAYAIKRMNPNSLERILDKSFDRSFVVRINDGSFYNKFSLGELYYILRKLSESVNLKKQVQKLTDSRK